jgi:putative hemolysin
MIFIETLVILLLVLINGLLAMSELALVSARTSRLQSLVSGGSRKARIALRLRDDPTEFLSTVQIGITLVGVLAGAFSGATLAERLAEWLGHWPSLAPYARSGALGVVVLGITYISLIFGELVPKRIALHNPERIASLVAPAMVWLARIAAPAVWLLKASIDASVRALRLRGRREATVTEDEVRLLVAEGTRAGVFAPKERRMIEGVLRLEDQAVRAIMTPRLDVAWLEEHADAEEIAQQLRERRLSRFPVCRESIDHPVGIVHAKDLVPAALEGEPIVLANYMVQPLVVPDGISVLKLLDSFRREGVHMALVVDEYGAIEGVVTLADVLEAIAGDLPELGETPEPGLVRRSDGSWLVDGDLPIGEFEDGTGLRGMREEGEFDTMAGWLLQHLGRLPVPGDAFVARSGRFEVVDMDRRRIDKILYVPHAGNGGAPEDG